MHLLHPPPRYPEPLPAVGEALYYPIGAYSPFTGLVTSPYRHGSRRPLPPLLEDDRAAEALFSLHPVPGGAGVRDAQGVNLVLGILPSGDYALLLPSHSVHIPGSLPTPHTASEFLSLSPAHYPTKEKLLAALKRTKERKAAHLGPGRRGNAGRLAAFEHARIFYKMYGPASYTLLGAPANRAAPHILVIQFNLWCPLTSAQDAAPVLLDAAWARADLRTGTLEEEQYVVCHGALRQPGQEWAAYKNGTPVVVPEKDAAALLRAYITALPPGDILLLTHDVSSLSRALVHLGLEDLFPQAGLYLASEERKRYAPASEEAESWVGVGALVEHGQLCGEDRGRERSPPRAEGGRYASAPPGWHAREGSPARYNGLAGGRYSSAPPHAPFRSRAGIHDRTGHYRRERSRHSSAARDQAWRELEDGEVPEADALFRPETPQRPRSEGERYTARWPSTSDSAYFQTPTVKREPDPPRKVFLLDTERLYASVRRMWTSRLRLAQVAADLGVEGAEGLCAGNEILALWEVAKRLMAGPNVFEARESIGRAKKEKEGECESGPHAAEGEQQEYAGMFGAPGAFGTGLRAKGKERDLYDEVLGDDEW